MNVDEQQMMAVAKVLEGAEETAKTIGMTPSLTSAALAIAAGSFAGALGLDLEELLDVVAKAWNGARAGFANAEAGTGDVLAGAAAEHHAEHHDEKGNGKKRRPRR